MKPYHETAEDVVMASKGKRGAKPCYMSSLLKVVEKPFQQQYGTPKLVELNVLIRNLTDKAKAQAARRQKAHNWHVLVYCSSMLLCAMMLSV